MTRHEIKDARADATVLLGAVVLALTLATPVAALRFASPVPARQENTSAMASWVAVDAATMSGTPTRRAA